MKRSLLILFLFGLSIRLMAQTSILNLDKGWQFNQQGQDKTYPAKVPGTVHTDLLQNQLIPDPFYGENEQKVRWVEDQTWVYETSFDLSSAVLTNEHQELVFEGLDTYAKVYLNEQVILEADNMFRTWKIPVKHLLKAKNNQLRIVFEPVVAKARALAAQLPYTLPGEEKVFVRKAQYQFGWDWGPRLVTCGIWKPIKLICWNENKLEEVQVRQKSLKTDLAELEINYKLAQAPTKTLNISGSFTDQDTRIKIQGHIKAGKRSGSIQLFIKNPKKWWSNGLGEAHLYQLKLNLNDANQELDSYQTSIGLRTIELVQQKDSMGSSFYFKLNGQPIFIKGANSIPTDSFTPRTSYADYENLVLEAKNQHMNMLRVWGGGIYADDAFYELCDKNGLLVWQDLMFAGSPYPADANFLKNIGEEIKDQAIRLRNHPSLALWCGNNEISEGWFNWGWQKQYNYSKTDSAKIKHDYDASFEQYIPSVLKEVDPDRFYHPSSPANGWGREKSYREADVHYWGVWWGMEPFEDYEKKVGRFVSEYGFQGMPEVNSLKKHLAQADLALFSNGLKNHQKHAKGFETISTYMERKFPMPKSLDDYAYLSQLVQAKGMKTAIEAHRRAKPYCMGTLYWQLNDCWPVTSWSTIDYYGMPKAAHYALSSLYQDLLISVVPHEESYQIHIVSDLQKAFKGQLKIQLLDVNGQIHFQQTLPVEVDKNSAQIYATLRKQDLGNFDPKRSVLYFELINNQEVLAKQHFYFVKDKELELPAVQISINKLSDESFLIKTDQLTKGVFLAQEGWIADQNYFDLLSGEEKLIRFKPAKNSDKSNTMPSVITLNQVLEKLKD